MPKVLVLGATGITEVNVVASSEKQTSPTDTTAGAVLTVGAFGSMGGPSFVSLAASIDDPAQTLGVRTIAGSQVGTLPSSQIPGFPDDCLVETFRRASGAALVQEASTTLNATARKAFRSMDNSNVWTSWVEIQTGSGGGGGGVSVTPEELLNIIRDNINPCISIYPKLGGYKYVDNRSLAVSPSTLDIWGDGYLSSIRTTATPAGAGLISATNSVKAQLTTGTSATGQAMYLGSLFFDKSIAPKDCYAYIGGVKVITPAALSTAAEDYRISVAFGIGYGLDMDLTYRHTSAGGNWQLSYKRLDGQDTYLDTGVAVTANTVFDLRFEVLWDTVTAGFKLYIYNGNTLVTTITSLRINDPAILINTTTYYYVNMTFTIKKYAGVTPVKGYVPIYKLGYVLK